MLMDFYFFVKLTDELSTVVWAAAEQWEEEAEQRQSLACIKVLLKISFAFQKEEDP